MTELTADRVGTLEPTGGLTPKRSTSDMLRSVGKHTLMILASLAMIYPLVWLLVSSLRPTDIIFRTPGIWLIPNEGVVGV